MGKPDFGTSGDPIFNRTEELHDPKGLMIVTLKDTNFYTFP